MGCTVICASVSAGMCVTAARSGAWTVTRAATGRAAPGSGKDAPAGDTVLAAAASRSPGAVHTATTSPAGPIAAHTRTSPSRPSTTP